MPNFWAQTKCIMGDAQMANGTVLWDEFCPVFFFAQPVTANKRSCDNVPKKPIVQFDTTLAQSQTSPQNVQTSGNPSQIGQERIMEGNYLTLCS